MTIITPATQEKTTPLCIFCATRTEKKKVFSKELYKCPHCKRSVVVENLV